MSKPQIRILTPLIGNSMQFALIINLFLAIGCEKDDSRQDQSSSALSAQDFRIDDLEKLVDDLEKEGNWQELVKLLPQNGKNYNGKTVTVVDAIGRIGNQDALPALEKLKNNSVERASGEFWVALEVAIRRLKNNANQVGEGQSR